MKRVFWVVSGLVFLFSSAAAARAQSLSAQQILAKVSEAYRGLHDYQFDAVFSIHSSTAGYVMSMGDTRYNLGVSAPGKVRLDLKSSGLELVVVSDGKTTWWYLPGKKIFTRETAAATFSSDEEEDDNETDELTGAERRLALRYNNIEKLALWSVLKREDRLKVSGGKVQCYVVELHLPKSIHELWIDKERFLVLRHKESNSVMVNGTPVQMDTQLDLKQASLSPPQSDLFAFSPPANSHEVQALGIPGERVSLAGKAAADFSLKDTQGAKVNLSDFRGKVVLLDFWASWCGPCREELPRIVKLYEKLKDKELVVFGVNDEDAGTIRSYLKKYDYGLPTLVDSNQSVHKMYGVRAIPTIIIIGRDGVVAADYVGERSDEELVAALKAAGL